MYWILGSFIIAALFYFYLVKPFTYWARRGIPQKSLFKEWADLIRMVFQLAPQAEIMRNTYNEFSNKRYGGAYQFLSPVLYITDPDLIKQITIKDFDHFVDHKQVVSENIDPLLGKNLLALKGDRWRDMRATLSPSFTSNKMRGMFILMNETAKQFVNYFSDVKGTHTVDMKDAFTRYANDVIASAAFGIECDSLKEPNNEFYLMGKDTTNIRGFWRTVSFFLMFAAPKLTRLLGIKFFSMKIEKFFKNLVVSNIESREKRGLVRPDMIHLLMEAKNGRLKHENQNNLLDSGFAIMEDSFNNIHSVREKPQLTDDDLTAQALLFFFAGFESVSTLMCFLTYELAVNQDVQETLREEVDETAENCKGSLTYESLFKMKYMDMVVSEALRKWPVAVGSDRMCVKPYTIQPEKEGEVPLHIVEGDALWLPIFGIQRDPQFYPNSERFDPERFSDDNKSNIYPYSYIPFGAGPRLCIGNRFALLEIKTIVFHMLSHFIIEVTDKTTVPLKLARNQINLSAENGFWFQLKPRSV